jgi:DNA modification methylase
MQDNLFHIPERKACTEQSTFLNPLLLDTLLEKISDLRNIEGSPNVNQETVVSFSLPPYYTLCPNPFLNQFTNSNLIDTNVVLPFTQDVSVGKNDPIYFAHYYSTKVPPQAILPYILHYTTPGDTVFDGFCGTGMTGIATQLCTSNELVQALHGESGHRNCILIDLSPAATFISALTNIIGHIQECLPEITKIIKKIEKKHVDLLQTNHVGWHRDSQPRSLKKNAIKVNDIKGRIEYIVWSDVFICPVCHTEFVLWDLIETNNGNLFMCPNCSKELTIHSMERAWISTYDHELQVVTNRAKQVPVLINYSVGSKRFEKSPDDDDLKIMRDLEKKNLPYDIPIVAFPAGVNTNQPRKSHGVTHVHHLFTKRNLVLMSSILHEINTIENQLIRMALLYVFTGSLQRTCKLNRYMPEHDRHVGPLSGTYYISQLTAEIPFTNYCLDRVKDIGRCYKSLIGNGVSISTQSASDLQNINSDSIDYIFTDPPFGGNLNYSELNLMVEAWLGAKTNATAEAIVNEIQNKCLPDYQNIMTSCFKEFYRILKSQHWMTIEFHNSSNAVWNSIQESLLEAGFQIADVRTLDKQKGTTKQLSYGATVKQDLIISAYKPSNDLITQFTLIAGTTEGVWSFIHNHLKQLPIFTLKNNIAEFVSERQPFLLYDRMVAFHIRYGVTVPLAAADFYKGLTENFPERDGMFFLPEQCLEYDKKRMQVNEVQQLTLIVKDEPSAIQWLRRALLEKPQQYSDLFIEFHKQTNHWEKHEITLELQDILNQNFLNYNGTGDVPSQIHNYLSTNFHELRNLSKDNPVLQKKAKDRWYVPDHNKEADLMKIREKSLLRQFEEYKQSVKKLKQFRIEAVKAGFRKAWSEKDYSTIINVSEKLPVSVIENDHMLLLWQTSAQTRLG